MENDIVCRFFWGLQDEKPKLIIEFNPSIHPENIKEISDVVLKTIQKKIDCMNAYSEESHNKLH